MNEKLINIHKYLFDNKLTKSDLNTWVSNVSSNDEIQTNIHKYLFDNKLTKSDFDTWKTNVGLKKKDSLDSTQEEAASVSPSQEKAKPTLSVGGKQVKTTPSDSSAGENKVNPFDRNQKSVKPSSSQALLGLTTYGPKESKDKELLDKFAKPLSKEEEVLLNKAGDSALLNMKESGTGGKVEQTSYLDKKNEAINKETSLMSAKIDAENSREILNEFKSSTQVTPDMEQTIQDDIMNEVQNEGLWNNIKQGASKAWNEVSPHIRLGSVTLPSGAQEMIKTDETFLNKRKEEERNLMISKEGFKPEEITDEVLTQRAINSELKSRIEDKKISLVNDYMDGLPSDVRSKLKFNANMSLQASAPEAIEADKLFKYVKATDTFLEDMSKKIFELQDIAKENKGLNQEQFSEYNSLISEAESLIESRNSSYEKYVSIKDKITTAEEDYDFLKRTYGFENTFTRFLNVASDFGLNMAQFANMAKYGPSKDLAAMQIADLRNEKDEYFEGKLQKEVENLQSVNDYLDYIGGVFVDQSINLALGVPAKGAFLLPTLFASSAGGRYTELTTSNLKGETNYTPLQMYLSSGVYGAAETAESATLKMIGKGKSVVSKALKNEPSRKILSESLTKSVYNGGKEFLKDLRSEYKEEITTSVAQKISDIIILDMEAKDVFKDFSSEMKNIAGSTLTMTVGLNIAPQAFGKIVKAFSPKDYTVALDRNNKTIDELSKIINNENVSEIAKKEAKSKIDDIVNANDKSLKALLTNMSEMNADLLDKVVKNEIKSSELRNKAKEINNDKTLSKSDKAVLLDGIKKEYIKSESDRESILNGSKTSFDILSKEKQEQLNNKAKSEIIKEKGLDVDAEVSVEEINKKARLDYNNKVKSDTQNKTLYINRDPKRGEVDAIPETLPKGYEYYKIVSNAEELGRWKEQKTKNQENEEGITAKQEEPTREVSSIETTTAQAEGETLLQEEVVEPKTKVAQEVVLSDILKLSDEDLEKRQAELEEKGFKTFSKESKEFNEIDKELEKREWQSVLNAPLNEVIGIVDNLIIKDKEMPNGYGSYIEKSDAKQTKEIAKKYSQEVSKLDAKKDFKDAFFGRPESWYADALKIRESVRVFTEKGGSFKELLQGIQREFEQDGFSEQDAARVIKNKLDKISKANEVVTEQVTQEEVAQPLRDVESTAKALNEDLVNSIEESTNMLFPKTENTNLVVSERYHKAKQDGTDPELVQAVENLLAPTVEVTQPKTIIEEEKIVEEVDTLRAKEQEELLASIPNADLFLTDGKVDKKKLTLTEDIAKFEEIYNKYDKLISPLLNNIKTQKDAIQKQSTGEVSIQPGAETSKEVEQGKSEAKPKEPTKQDEKEVKTKKDKTEKVSDKEQIKELKGLVSDLFNAAKEAVKITKDRFNTIENFKKDATKMVNNGVKDLSDIKFKDRAKRQAQSVINSITDKNINEKLNKINKILDSVSKSDTKEVGSNLDKEVKKVSNPKYTRVKSDGKVPKSKITDNIKKRMEQEKKKFSKIKSPTNLQKKYFVDIMSKLLDKGIKERKKIEETRKNKSQRKSDKVASDVLVKAGKSRGFVSIDINDSVKLDEAFESGGVIYDGKIYNNKKSLIKDATSENESKGEVKLQKVSLSQTPSNADSNRSWWDRNISDTIRKYKYKNFSARTFFESMITDSNRDFINKNFRLPLQKYSEVIGRKQAEFNDIRDGFFNEILDLKDTKKSKLTLPTATIRFLISKSRDLRAKKNKKGTERLWAFSGKNEIKFSVKINGEEKSGTFFGLVDFFDNTIKQETNKDVIEKLKVDKENFKNKYFSFDEMNNQGVAVLFNMIRQPDGLQKFLNTGFTHQDAIAIVDYVNSNEFIRDIADKSTDIFQKIRDYVNPTLDNLGYETLGEVDFLTEEDAMSISKDPEATKKNYEVLKKIYPNGIPEKIPYFPLSTEGLSGVSESATLSFFEQSDNPNGDYSLLYPSLFSRTAGGKLNLNNLSVFSSFDTASKDAITLVEGQEIMTNTRNLFSNPANNIAFTSAYGKDWVRAFQSKVTTIVKDNAYEESMSKSGKFVKFLVKTSGISRVSQLAINYFSSAVQLTSSGVTYFKEDNLKVLPKLIKDLKDKSKRRDVLDGLKKSYNEIVNSDNYKGRVNKRKDSIEISLVKSVKGKEGFSFIQSLMTDALYLTTLSDMLSVVMLTPIHYYKHNTNNGKTVSENMDNFFSEEVNTTLQSNASFYMGTTFYSKFAAITGLGSYLQAPRQAFEQVAYTIISLPKSKNIVDFSTKMASIIGTGSFAFIIPSMLRDFLRGDDEDEETQSDADQKTSMLKTANEVFDSILDSMGFGGTSISVVKNAALAKYSPDVLGIAIQPSEIRANDILIASTKALPNIGIRLRALDNAIDKKEIYTNTDQFIYGLETGLGFGGAFIKKQADYIGAVSKEYYDYSDYWDLVSGKVTLSEFKSFDKEINKYSEVLEKRVYPKYTNGNTLNLSFLNEEQRLNLNKMSLSQKNEYINEIRVNLIRKDIVDEVVLLKGKDESLNEEKKFYFVRAAKFKNELSDDFFEYLKDNLIDKKGIKFEGLEDRIMSFKEDENISEGEAAKILKQVFQNAQDKLIDYIKGPLIKQAEKYNTGKDRANFIYEKIGDVNSPDNIMYLERISDVLDKTTQAEYINILKSSQK